jgi:hypothetical protein
LEQRDENYDLKKQIKALQNDKPGMCEYIYKEKQQIQAETDKKI